MMASISLSYYFFIPLLIQPINFNTLLFYSLSYIYLYLYYQINLQLPSSMIDKSPEYDQLKRDYSQPSSPHVFLYIHQSYYKASATIYNLFQAISYPTPVQLHYEPHQR
jgi:hypothetical protein